MVALLANTAAPVDLSFRVDRPQRRPADRHRPGRQPRLVPPDHHRRTRHRPRSGGLMPTDPAATAAPRPPGPRPCRSPTGASAGCCSTTSTSTSPPARSLVVTGPSGSGKSTLLAMAGLLRQPPARRRAGRRHLHRRRSRADAAPPCAATTSGSSTSRPTSSARSRRASSSSSPATSGAGPDGEVRAHADQLLEELGLADRADQLPGAAVRRRAPAGRHRPGADGLADGAAGRRADGVARPRARRRGGRAARRRGPRAGAWRR